MTSARRTLTAWVASAAAVAALAGCGGASEADSVAAARADVQKADYKSATIHAKAALQKNPQSGEARYLLARALVEIGDFTGSREELEKARAAGGNPSDVLPLLARVLLAVGQPQKVIEQLSDKSLPDTKGSAALKAYVASALFQLSRFDEAAAQVSEALKLDPKNPDARLTDALVTARRERYDDALAKVDALLADEPKLVSAWMLKGELLWGGKKDLDGAAKAFRQALAVQPTWVSAHVGLIALAQQRKDVAAYRAQVNELKKAAPNTPQALLFDTELALMDNDLERARAGAEQLLRVAPKVPRALMLAGNVELRTGAVVQARTHLAQAVQLQPDNGVARRALALAMVRSGQGSEALATLKPLLERPQPGADVLEVAAQAYLQAGDSAKAEAYYQRAAQAHPGDPQVRVALAVTKIARGESAAGLSSLEAVAASDKGVSADMALVSLHLSKGDLDAAFKDVERLQGKLPNDPLPQLLRGRVLRLRGDLAGARGALDKALVIDAKYFPAIAELAAIDMADNKPAAARQRYEELLKREARNPVALLTLADIRQRMGDKPEAVEALIADAVRANPFDPTARLALVEHRLQRRMKKEALSTAQEAVAALPDDPPLQEALGRAQLAAGDSQQAMATFRKVADTDGAPSETYLRVAQIYAEVRDYDTATAVLKKALRTSPNLLDAQRGLIELALKRKRPAEALEVARQVQKQRPNEAVGHLMEATLAAKQQSWDAAFAAGREALKRERTAAVAIQVHGLYLLSGRKADAERFADAWRRERPDDLDFVAHLGSMALTNKDYAGAEAQYRIILAARPNDPLALNNVAWTLVKQGKPGALLLAEKATQLAPNAPAFMDTMSQVLQAQKQAAPALDWARKAVAAAPDKAEYRLNLAKALIANGDKAQARSELEKLAALGGRFSGQADVSRLMTQL